MNGPLTFIYAGGTSGGRQAERLHRDEIEANKALARQWRQANPEFFATDPATLPDPKSWSRGLTFDRPAR